MLEADTATVIYLMWWSWDGSCKWWLYHVEQTQINPILYRFKLSIRLTYDMLQSRTHYDISQPYNYVTETSPCLIQKHLLWKV